MLTLCQLQFHISANSLISTVLWCFSGGVFDPYPFIIMVSFLTSISSNDYARLRSRIIVISCNIFVYILCSKLVFPRIPVLCNDK